MPFYTNEEIEKAREMDLLTYLRNYEPFELVKVHGNTYCTRQHDSLKISNGKWMWWSKGIGGASALDYLIKVKGESFTDAVGRILGKEGNSPPIFSAKPKEVSSKKLLLPDKSESTATITSYLTNRGIDKEIIQGCIDDGILYESLPYHNFIFVGFDEGGVERFASFRGTGEEKLMGDAAGSDKKYSFRLNRPGSILHVFESPIDLLSYLTLRKKKNADSHEEPMLSLGGIFFSGSKYKTPIALSNFLESREDIKRIALHLDNDFAGRSASLAIQNALKDRYEVIDEPPRFGKDYNEELLIRLQREAERKKRYER